MRVGGARRIGILDPQQEAPAQAACQQQVEQRRAHIAEVQLAAGARCKTGHDGGSVHLYNVNGCRGPMDEFIVTTLFVSDLHLDAAFPAAVAQFASFLQEEARDAEALYILGDLFESWVGDDDDDAERAGVCAALRALSDEGVACHVCHGNRDFLLGTGFEQRTGCRLLADPTIIDLYGERVLLTHGDALCTADPSYQRLRSVVRDPAWQRRFLRRPLAPRPGPAPDARPRGRPPPRQAAPGTL